MATKYGYNYKDNPGAGKIDVKLNSASTLLSMLKLGYPIIAKTRDAAQNNESADHWVTVTSFSGDDASPSFSNFTCYDPAGSGKWTSLPNSDRFYGFYRYVYYY